MSADSWTFCPKCDEKNKQVIQEKTLDIKNFLDNPISLKETLREDWEIGTYEGIFEVSYVCFCSECGYKYQFNFSKSWKEK